MKDSTVIRVECKRIDNLATVYPDSAMREAYALLRPAIALRDFQVLVSLYILLGNICVSRDQYDSSLIYWQKGLQATHMISDKSARSILCNNIGNVYMHQSKYEQAGKYYAKAIQYAGYWPAPTMPVEAIYQNYAHIFLRLNQIENAAFYFNKVLKSGACRAAPHKFAGSFIGMGTAYVETGEDSLAELYLDSAISLSDKHNLYNTLHQALNNLARLKIKKEQYMEALKIQLRAKDLAPKHPINAYDQNSLIANIGYTYLLLKQYPEAEHYLLYANAMQNRRPMDRKYLAGQLCALYAEQKQFEKAYHYGTLFHKIKDSIQNKEITLKFSEQETRYRSAEKDKEIAIQKSKIYKKNFWIIGIASGSMTIIGLLFSFIFYRNKKRHAEKELEHLKAVMEGEEKERSRLSKDLHDGVNSHLNAITNRVAALKNPAFAQHNEENITTIETMLQRASATVRRVAHNLAPDELVKNGLSDSVREFCTSALENAGITLDIQVYRGVDHIPAELALSIYRITQELVQNIIKHANATRVIIMLFRNNQTLHLLVEDNGRGLPETVRNGRQSGMGYNSIKERIKVHRGQMFLDIEPHHKGLVIEITFPVLE